jgi:hypothetical protein
VCGTPVKLVKASPGLEVDRSGLSAVRYPTADEVEGSGSHCTPGRAPRLGSRRKTETLQREVCAHREEGARGGRQRLLCAKTEEGWGERRLVEKKWRGLTLCGDRGFGTEQLGRSGVRIRQRDSAEAGQGSSSAVQSRAATRVQGNGGVADRWDHVDESKEISYIIGRVYDRVTHSPWMCWAY